MQRDKANAVISIMLYKWNGTVCSLWGAALFTQRVSLETHPGCGVSSSFS